MKKIIVLTFVAVFLVCSVNVFAENSVLNIDAIQENDKVIVQVSIENNPSIAAFLLKLVFSDGLSPQNVICGDIASGGVFVTNLKESEAFEGNILNIYNVCSSDFTDDGVIFTVEFSIIDKNMSDAQFSLLYDQGDIIDEKYNEKSIATNEFLLSITKNENHSDKPKKPSGTINAPGMTIRDESAKEEAAETEKIEEEKEENNITENPFADVDERAWYFDAVINAYNKGLFIGDEKGFFNPDEYITREMLVEVLARFCNAEYNEKENVFKDVSEDMWFYRSVIWANSNGYVKGISEDIFGCGLYVTREQAVTIIMRYSDDNNEEKLSETVLCNDNVQISGWARGYVSSAMEKGIIKGDENGCFRPSDNITRAEAAVIFNNLALKQ